ncbi:MAG TPA: NAD(P)H-quinone oxidoreductase [Pseudonocardiaceae bacterium]|jgi:NADPH2:quinone reductase|nr:NAD(P)H-quinone oxidoreductase [Pseudonocardiaceae bacterium]
MHAITIREPGGPDVLTWTELPDPTPGPGEVLLDIAASAVNRADLLQRQGFYPPPPGASDVPGLECSGTVAELGAGVTGWAVGDQVCALLAGGGYAERVVVPAAQVLPVPAGVSLVDAAALPEVACTVWSNVVMVAGLGAGDVFLVHGGAGGIGTHAIQVGKALGATVAATAGSAEKLDLCRQLGADILINYREQDFVEQLRAATDGHGADVVLDNMGASYLDRNIDALATGGRLSVIGMQGGVKAELNIGKLMGKRASVASAGLRARPVDGPDGKGRIVAAVRDGLWPLIASGAVRPLVHSVLPCSDAAEAHRAMEASEVLGKVLLKLG